MKHLFFVLCAVLCLSSCMTITSEIWVNADGSGKATMTQDLSELYPMVSMFAEMEAEKLKANDSIDSEVSNMMSNILGRERIDTTFTLEGIFNTMSQKDDSNVPFSMATIRDSLKAEANDKLNTKEFDILMNLLEKVLKTPINVDLDKEAGRLVFSHDKTFSDVNNMYANFEKAMPILMKLSEDNEQLGARSDVLDQIGKRESISMDKKWFKLSMPNQGMDEEIMDMSDDESAQMMQMMESFKMNYIIHLPGNIKSAANPDVIVDGNTASFTVPLMELMKGKEDFNVDIKYKQQKGFVH